MPQTHRRPRNPLDRYLTPHQRQTVDSWLSVLHERRSGDPAWDRAAAALQRIYGAVQARLERNVYGEQQMEGRAA